MSLRQTYSDKYLTGRHQFHYSGSTTQKEKLSFNSDIIDAAQLHNYRGKFDEATSTIISGVLFAAAVANML